MIPYRRFRHLPLVATVAALITLSVICPQPTSSISDQQQQQQQQETVVAVVASESQQQSLQTKQALITQQVQPQPTSNSAATTTTITTTRATKNPSTTEQNSHAAEQQAKSGHRNTRSQQAGVTTRQTGKARRLQPPTRAPPPATSEAATPSATNSQSTVVTSDQSRQDEVTRLAMIYQNTPPLFVTPTRDFYVDVARHSVGFKLTTIQAIDMDGDPIEYSLKPAKFLDASPYFAINATNGDLRLASKQIFEPKQVLSSLDDASSGEDNDEEMEDSSPSSRQPLSGQLESQTSASPSYLYFLNVVAWDGQYTSVIELKIHVSNLTTQLGTSSPVRLTPEGGLNRGAESLMRAKTDEFLSGLYSSSSQQSRKFASPSGNATMVLPNFINPPLLLGGGLSDSGATKLDELNPGDDLLQQQQQQLPNKSFQMGDNQPLLLSTSVNLMNQQASESLQQQRRQAETAISDAAVSINKQQGETLLVQQPVLFSIIMIVCACLVIAFVLLVFIVPISVRRLKKRLKTMERQHEQLSQKASNGGSSIVGSCLSHDDGSMTMTNSMTTTNGSSSRCHGLPSSSLSQFTLASSDRSCAMMFTMTDQQRAQMINHEQLCRRKPQLNRQSSLDSATTSRFENYNLSQAAASSQIDSIQGHIGTAHQPHASFNSFNDGNLNFNQRSSLHQGNNMQITCLTNHSQHFLHHRHQHAAVATSAGQQQMQMQTNSGLNRINNGAIVNPVYLQRLNGANNDITTKQQTNNIYCPIDDEFYSTINTETTGVEGEQELAVQNLYTMQRQQHQLGHDTSQSAGPSHNQIGLLFGQTGDSRSFLPSQSAHPIRLMRDTCSPTLSTASSRSSTRSLARFLSLPARHLSHNHRHQDESNDQLAEGDQKTSAALGDLEIFDQPASARKLERLPQKGDKLAKTIARADRINHEQQVGHRSGPKKSAQAELPTASINDDDDDEDAATGWEIERHRLKFLNILDEGQFGLVWRCKLRMAATSDCSKNKRQSTTTLTDCELTVAVKTLKSFAAKDIKERDELLAEIEIMKLVCQHPNVVRILHCCVRDISPNRPILLIMEHVELGKLQSYLEKSRTRHLYSTSGSIYNQAGERSQLMAGNGGIGRDYRMVADSVVSSMILDDDDEIIDENDHQQAPHEPPTMDHTPAPGGQLTSRELIKFIYHVAKGMEYISSQCIVHRDLASRNILINAQRVCKIGDFGMARHMDNVSGIYERHSRNTKVPVRWMAPEVLLENSYTTKSDVFSFGILMWEIVTLGSTPYCHLKTDQIIQAVARQGERPERPEYCHELLYSIMSSCWSHDPTRRPSFLELVQQLDGLLMSTEEYIQLDQYPDHNYYNIPQTAAPLELL